MLILPRMNQYVAVTKVSFGYMPVQVWKVRFWGIEKKMKIKYITFYFVKFLLNKKELCSMLYSSTLFGGCILMDNIKIHKL